MSATKEVRLVGFDHVSLVLAELKGALALVKIGVTHPSTWPLTLEPELKLRSGEKSKVGD